MSSSRVALANGVEMPLFGLGTYLQPESCCKGVVKSAVELGYTLVDTAICYRNETAVGDALQEVDPDGKVWITTKIPPTQMGYDQVLKAFEESVKKLHHVDLLLLHWPGCAKFPPNSPELRKIRHESWKACEELLQAKRVRAIGVSNYLPHHLEQLKLDGATTTPMVNQIEMHPDCPAGEIKDYCMQHGIVVQAYSPLGTAESGLVTRPAVVEAAKVAGVSPAQALILWPLLQKCATIPKASSVAHLQDNLKALDAMQHLEADTAAKLVEALAAAGQNRRYCWDPYTIA